MKLVHWVLGVMLQLLSDFAHQAPQCFTRESLTDTEPHIITSNQEANTECHWEINASTYYENNILRLTSVEDDFEDGSDCDEEYMKVYAGIAPLGSESQPLATVCRNSTQEWEFFLPDVTIVFRTGPRMTAAKHKFHLQFQAINVSRCSKTLIANNEPENLITDNYPYPYPSFQRCTYHIKPEDDTNIELNIVFSDLNPYCGKASVYIFDGNAEDGPLIGKWCGFQKVTYKSLLKGLFIVFLSGDNSVLNNKGFRATYIQAIHGDYLQANTHQATMRFPGYINFADYFYQPVTCKWRVDPVGGHRVMVVFTNFHVSCPDNKIYIETGSDHHETCGTEDHMYLSIGATIWVKLTSKVISLTPISFHMKYRTVEVKGCEGHQEEVFKTTNGVQTLRSPGYPLRYPDHMTCIWRFVPEMESGRVELSFQIIDFEDDSCNDYVAGYHGSPTKFSDPVFKLCSSKEVRVFTSDSHVATVYFSSNGERAGKGFVLHYRTHTNMVTISEISGLPTTQIAIIATVVITVFITFVILVIVVVIIRKRRQSARLQSEHVTHPYRASESASPFLGNGTDSDGSGALTAPPPSYQEVQNTPVLERRPEVSDPLSIPPPSYSDAVSKGMILDSDETGF